MIAISSSGVAWAYQQWFILYRGKHAIFCLQFSQLIRLLSKVMLFWVYNIWYDIGDGNTPPWAQIFQCYFITLIFFFFSKIFDFNVWLHWKTGHRFFLYRSRIHVSPFLLPHSSHIQKEPMDNRFLCRLVAGRSGRMLGSHRWCFWTDSGESWLEYDQNLSRFRLQSFCCDGNHYPLDKRYSCFPSHIMAFIP